MPPNQKQNKKYPIAIPKILGIAFELGFIIALPLILLGFAGKWLDHKYGKNFFVYIGIMLALISTSIWLWQRFKRIIRDFEDAVKKAQQQTNKQISDKQIPGDQNQEKISKDNNT